MTVPSELESGWSELASAIEGGQREAQGRRALLVMKRLHDRAMDASATKETGVLLTLATIEIGRLFVAIVLSDYPDKMRSAIAALDRIVAAEPAGAIIIDDPAFSARWILDRAWVPTESGYEQIGVLYPRALLLLKRIMKEVDRSEAEDQSFELRRRRGVRREIPTPIPPLSSRTKSSIDTAAGGTVQHVLPVGAIAEHDHVRIAIWYGTTRQVNAIGDLNDYYGSERSESSKLSHGRCEVAIPREKKFADLPRPRWWLFERSENPAKHVMVLRMDPLSETDFLDSVRNANAKTAFLFIHGFNVSFAEAARRTAQLAYDLQFPGLPLLFSWPAKGVLGAYAADEASMEASVSPLTTFLEQVCFQTGISQIHVVAHSMGARCLVRATESLASRSRKQVCRQLVLTAPDIDQDELRNVAPSLVSASKRMTIYASSEDLAIKASRKIHAEPRAGESGPALLILPKVDTIDVSRVSTGFIAHSYYGENTSVVTDLFSLLKLELPPDRRPRLEKLKSTKGQYWRFAP